VSVTARCQNCGLERDPQDTGPCPRCGHQGRHLVAVINEVVGITDRVGSYISPNYRPTTRDRVSVFSVFLIAIAEFFVSFFPSTSFYNFWRNCWNVCCNSESDTKKILAS